MKKIARNSSKAGYSSIREIERDIAIFTVQMDQTKDEMVKDNDFSDMYLNVIVEHTEVIANLTELRNNFDLIKLATKFVNL